MENTWKIFLLWMIPAYRVMREKTNVKELMFKNTHEIILFFSEKYIYNKRLFI